MTPPRTRWALIICLFFIQPSHADEEDSMPLQPNIFMVFTDDMSWGEIGATGNTIIQTPHLDQLYHNSLRFNNFHVAPACAPSRAQIMSGRHNYFAGVSRTTGIRSTLRDDITILPEVMKMGNYRTGMFGKWHLGFYQEKGLTGKSQDPFDRGFDRALYSNKQLIPIKKKIAEETGTELKDYKNRNQFRRFDPPMSDNGEIKYFKGYCADVLFDEAMKWSEDDAEAPVFTYLATGIPHTPIGAPQKHYDLYKDTSLTADQQGFYAMVSALDDNMGRLVEWIKNRESKRDTILIFMTDNGHAIKGPGPTGMSKKGIVNPDGLYNAGMRGGKSHFWHGGTCVPFLLYWKGIAEEERICTTLSSGMDILPTFAEIGGIEYSDPGIQGVSLLPDILGEGTNVSDDRILFTKSSNWQYSTDREQARHTRASAFNATHRLVWSEPGDPEYKALYHYAEELGETKNVIDQHPEIAAKLEKAYNAWWDAAQKEMVHDNYLAEVGEVMSGVAFDPEKKNHIELMEKRKKEMAEEAKTAAE